MTYDLTFPLLTEFYLNFFFKFVAVFFCEYYCCRNIPCKLNNKCFFFIFLCWLSSIHPSLIIWPLFKWRLNFFQESMTIKPWTKRPTSPQSARNPRPLTTSQSSKYAFSLLWKPFHLTAVKSNTEMIEFKPFLDVKILVKIVIS